MCPEGLSRISADGHEGLLGDPAMCGIIGVSKHKDAAQLAYSGLFALQHRGEEAAGIASFDGRNIYILVVVIICLSNGFRAVAPNIRQEGINNVIGSFFKRF